MSQTNIEIKLNEKYRNLVPRPNSEQRQALKESIQLEGQLEPIVVDKEGNILDGYTRYEICQELHLKPKLIIKDDYKDETDKENYVITVNLKRRHLNDFQIFELFEKQINTIARQNTEQRNRNIWPARQGVLPVQTYEDKKASSTLYKAKELTGLGVKTVELCRYLKKYGDDKIVSEVRDGKIGIHRAGYNVKQKQGKIRTYDVKHSRVGMILDIFKAIKINNEPKFSHIQKSTSMSSYNLHALLDALEDGGLVKTEKRTFKWKHYDKTGEDTFYHITSKGLKFFVGYKKLEKYLPKEFRY